jgi:hypothetical protein
MYIEQEQMRLIEEAGKAGITQGDIDKLIHSGNLSDYYIENAKIRLGIIEQKPPRVQRKTTIIAK